ncbi:hypothetical protein JW835_03455 [bacterium]|nr:hypothetical protein [bacterium]
MKRLHRHIFFTLVWMTAGLMPLFGQMIIKTPKQNAVIEKRRIAVTVVGRTGAKTWLYVNEALADSGEIRIDGKYDFLNIPVPEGPVELRAEAIGAGSRIYKAIRRVHIVGRPDTLITDQNRINLPADSQSVQNIHVKVQDAWGYAIQRLKTATVMLTKGSLLDTDIDSLSPGCQVPVENSEFVFTLRASSAVGREQVIIKVGDLSHEIPARYTTPLTPLMLVGSLDAAVSAAELGDKKHGTPKFTVADWTHQEGDVSHVPVSGRLAFYAKGALMKKYQVTASYDSRRTKDNQLFRDLDPDQQYALYGDASTLTYDAQTQSKFYGRIERNESFVSVGDFNTEFRSTDFTKYDRSFTGLFSKIHAGRHTFTGFATLNDRTMKLDEIRGEGISGYYYLTGTRITLNSDKIRIETRDRYHPEKIIRSDELVRFMDYDINYVDGTLMFKQPVPSVDSQGNPVYIIAAYERQARSDKSLIGGLRYEGTVKNLRFGSTLIMEEKEPSNFYMTGLDAELPVTRWLRIRGELAQTRNSDFTETRQTGNAYAAEMDLTPLKSIHLNGYYRSVDDDFSNPSQTGSRFEVGTEKVGTKNSLDLGKAGKIHTELYRQLNDIGTVNEYHVQVANTFYEYAFNKKTTARLGYEDAERKKTGQDSIEVRGYRSKMITGQVAHQWTERLSMEIRHEQNLAKGETTLPTGTSVGAIYALSKKLKLFLKQRFLDTDKRRTQTIFGIDTKVGKRTRITGKYEIGGASGEDLSRATIGLRNQWEVRKDLTLNIALESTATMDSLEVPTPDHNAVSVGIEYLPDRPWKSSAKFELMQDKIVRKHVITLGSEFKVFSGLSAIGRLEYAGANYLDTSDEVWNRGNYQLGVAFRPEQHDMFNGIAKLQLLTDKNTHAAPKTRLDRLITAAHGHWQASPKLGIGFRFALRRLLDEETGFFSSKTTTSLYSIRADYKLHRRWTTAIDMRLVMLSPIGQMKTGASFEAGYLLKKNMLVGAGYIFKQLDDPDFSFTEYNYGNIYLVLRMKFSEDIFNWR